MHYALAHMGNQKSRIIKNLRHFFSFWDFEYPDHLQSSLAYFAFLAFFTENDEDEWEDEEDDMTKRLG